MKKENQAKSAGKIVIGIILTIILGAIGSGLWEMFFKPGIGRIGNLITGVSHYIDDSIFTSAALDPLPIPSLIPLIILPNLPLLIATFFIYFGFIKKPTSSFFGKSLEIKEGENIEEHLDKITWKLRLTALTGAIFSILTYVTLITLMSTMNQSILVWRSFQKNLEICAPYIPNQERLSVISSFRLMKKRSDFIKIQSELNNIALKNQITLEWYNIK